MINLRTIPILLVAILISPGGVAQDLDLREANVVAVQVQEEDIQFHFAVTLLHDDDGEEGYADWWVVETLAGQELGRRVLTHAHGTKEFTRSQTLKITPARVWVVIRGHDQVHGYGGQAVIYNLENHTQVKIMQGPDPANFSTFLSSGISTTQSATLWYGAGGVMLFALMPLSRRKTVK